MLIILYSITELILDFPCGAPGKLLGISVPFFFCAITIDWYKKIHETIILVNNSKKFHRSSLFCFYQIFFFDIKKLVLINLNNNICYKVYLYL